jgi:hypothetical protein
MIMAGLDLADLRRELNALARGRNGVPFFVHDLTLAIMSAYGLEVAEAICDGLQKRVDQAHRMRAG